MNRPARVGEVLLLTVFLFVPWPATSADELCGAVCDDSLTTAGSPYVVTCDVIVAAGCTLSIDAGVELRFQAATGLTIEGLFDVTGTTDVPTPLEPDDLDTNQEAYEGVLIQVCGTCTVEQLLDYEEVLTSCVRLDDEIYSYSLAVNDSFNCIVGVYHYSFSEYKLLPRDAADFLAL